MLNARPAWIRVGVQPELVIRMDPLPVVHVPSKCMAPGLQVRIRINISYLGSQPVYSTYIMHICINNQCLSMISGGSQPQVLQDQVGGDMDQVIPGLYSLSTLQFPE